MSTLVDTLQPPPTEAGIITDLQQRVSASRLALFQSCRLRFYFRHVLGLRKPKTAALHVGVAVHAVLRGWNRDRWRRHSPGLTELHASYQEAWEAAQAGETVAWDDPRAEVEQQQSGWRLLETFFRESPLCEAGKPEAVEVRVEADLASHSLPTLVGVLDLVQDGRIVDFKTTATTPHPERAALVHATQAAAYALLYRENTGRAEAGIELHHLVKLKQPRLVVTALPPMREREQTRLLRVIDSYVTGLDRRDFIPSPSLQCVGCEFFAECAAWH